MSPFEIMYKRSPRLPLDVAFPNSCHDFSDKSFRKISRIMKEVDSNIKQSQVNQKKQYNKNSNLFDVKPGDHVYLHFPHSHDLFRNKLARLWRGPYEVIRETFPILHIKIGNSIARIHINRCKLAKLRTQHETTDEHKDAIPEEERTLSWTKVPKFSKAYPQNVTTHQQLQPRSTRIRKPASSY
ncbi:hypothetical protein RF11_15673 [Thelohanellus kitauei]|uniref:Integrase zinc-binding domain-containing protein n=1 Tax=Thelohanellus kitauei TaxID=669202 RepID=A0A0C2IX23_THEKT|nr:hypothetical protein RF11_15673 [Thelohanellus kitauei]